MNIYSYAKELLFGESLEEKLLTSNEIDLSYTDHKEIELPKTPGRKLNFKFSEKKMKFPKGENVSDPAKMGKALHFFANHELLAIEMMASAILVYPTITKADHDFKVGLIDTIQDEIKHFKLYDQRMNELGVEFGDFPLNDFFWKHMHDLKTPSEFYALMALTFEAANLDFAIHFHHLFKKIEDNKSSAIMKIVYEDEIKHVSRGAIWLNKWRGDKSLWQYYIDCLPEFVTPARSKGQTFDQASRKKAGLPSDFIDNVKNYKDDFNVTNRKSWK